MPFLNRIGSGTIKKFGFGAAMKPGAVTIGTATTGTNQATLTWTAPAGGGPVSDYVIEYSTDSGSTFTTFSHAVTTGTSIIVTGLTAGSSYAFRVAGSNPIGTGEYSGNSNSVTINGAPSAPTLTGVDAVYSRASVSWSAPATGFPTSYSYTAYAVASGYATRSATTSGTSVTISSLSTNVTYTFYVTATNAYGTSTSSSTTEFTDVPCPYGTSQGSITTGGFGTTCTYNRICDGDGGIGNVYTGGGCNVCCTSNRVVGGYCSGCSPCLADGVSGCP